MCGSPVIPMKYPSTANPIVMASCTASNASAVHRPELPASTRRRAMPLRRPAGVMRAAAPENLVIAGSMTRSENDAPAPACTAWIPALSSWPCRTWADRRVRDTVTAVTPTSSTAAKVPATANATYACSDIEPHDPLHPQVPDPHQRECRDGDDLARRRRGKD